MWDLIIIIFAVVIAVCIVIGAYIYASRKTPPSTQMQQPMYYRPMQTPPSVQQGAQTATTAPPPTPQRAPVQQTPYMFPAHQSYPAVQPHRTQYQAQNAQYQAQYKAQPAQPAQPVSQSAMPAGTRAPHTISDIPPPESDVVRKKPTVIPLKDAAEPAAVAPAPSEKKKYTKKIILIGDGGVGKTTLIRRFVYDMFDDKYIQTIGTKVSKKKIEFSEENVELTLMIWDVQGQRNDPLLHKYFVGAEGALMVCDVTRYQTYEHLPEWINEFYETVGKKVPIVLLANKSDLREQMQFGSNEMASMSQKYAAKYYLTSAKTGDNVEKAFRELGLQMIRM